METKKGLGEEEAEEQGGMKNVKQWGSCSTCSAMTQQRGTSCESFLRSTCPVVARTPHLVVTDVPDSAV